MKIGMLGCGTIGTFLLETLNKSNRNEKIVAIYSRNYEKTKEIATQYNATSYKTVEELLKSDLDLLVEVATIEVVKQYALQVIDHGIPLIVSSIGAFSDEDFWQQLKEKSEEKLTKVYIPSGAVGGLDLLQSAKVIGGLKSVTLTTRKPAHSLQGAEEVTEERILFEGKAKDVIARYPRNMNVAIALSLAGIGTEKTKVRLIADPQVKRNVHTIEANGEFGSFSSQVENEPMPDNPKTSYLAALSVLSSITAQSDRVQIG